jgi:plastocyanin
MRFAVRLAPLLCSCAAAILASCGGSDRKTLIGPDPACSGTLPAHVVRVANFAFDPTVVHVTAGDSVRWVHCGPEADEHTVTADSGSFASPFFGAGASYTHVFAAADSVGYHCTPHPTMVGTVVIDP